MKLSHILSRVTKTKLAYDTDELEKAFFGSVNSFDYITGHSKSNSSLPYSAYSILVKLMIAFFVSCELWYMFTECENWFQVVDSINVSVINLMAIYRYRNMMNHKEVFRKLTKSMELPYFDVESLSRKELLRHWIKMNADYTKLLLVLGHFTLLIWYIYPLIDDIDYNLCLKIRLPFYYHTPGLYPVAYILVVISFHLTASFVMINDLIMQTHLIHLICQFAVLGDCFENVIVDCLPDIVVDETFDKDDWFKDEEFPSKCIKRFNNLIDQHKTLLRYTEELKSILSTPMMGQVMISGTLICFAGYQVTQAAHAGIAKFLMSLLYLGYNMFELLIFCRWSDEINVQYYQNFILDETLLQSQNIRDAAYCSGWERGLGVVPGMRARVMFVIARATKPLVLTAGGMYDLSLESYTSLVKASYSALTVLLQFGKDE